MALILVTPPSAANIRRASASRIRTADSAAINAVDQKAYKGAVASEPSSLNLIAGIGCGDQRAAFYASVNPFTAALHARSSHHHCHGGLNHENVEVREVPIDSSRSATALPDLPPVSLMSLAWPP